MPSNLLIGDYSGTSGMSELMQELAIAFDSPAELDHNVAVLCFHPTMQEVKRVCKNFKLCQIKAFHSAEDFIVALNKSKNTFPNQLLYNYSHILHHLHDQ